MPGDVTRSAPDPWEIGFGVVVLAAALLALWVWFPNDIRGAFIEISPQGRAEPGDAFFPVLLATVLALLALVHLVVAAWVRPPAKERSAAVSGRLRSANIRFFVLFHAVVLTGVALMYWAGPLIVNLLGAIGVLDVEYRKLTDTVPYKYLGYVAGGFVMTAVLVVWAEGGFRWRTPLVVLAALAVAIIVFDVLLTNVQLPPNADY